MTSLGYRYTRFDSVAAGEEEDSETATLIVGTSYDRDLTADIELEASYNVQVGLEDTEDTNQDFSLLLSFEFIWDLDFDVTLVWKRVGQPEADADGFVPEEDDLRIDFGLSWSF